MFFIVILLLTPLLVGKVKYLIAHEHPEIAFQIAIAIKKDSLVLNIGKYMMGTAVQEENRGFSILMEAHLT